MTFSRCQSSLLRHRPWNTKLSWDGSLILAASQLNYHPTNTSHGQQPFNPYWLWIELPSRNWKSKLLGLLNHAGFIIPLTCHFLGHLLTQLHCRFQFWLQCPVLGFGSSIWPALLKPKPSSVVSRWVLDLRIQTRPELELF